MARGRVQLRDSPEKAGSGRLEASVQAWPVRGLRRGQPASHSAVGATPGLSIEPLLDAGRIGWRQMGILTRFYTQLR